jgi:hypothetical protein
MDDRPHLLDLDDLSAEEEASRAELERELLALHGDARRLRDGGGDTGRRRSWHFDVGPVTIICPDAPEELRGPLADPANPNYVGLLTFADLDALIELYGHIRAENPELQVNFVVASQVVADHLSGHVVLIGGVAWNPFVRDFLSAAKQVPVKQVEDEKVETGEVFEVLNGTTRSRFYPVWGGENGDALAQDVALVSRLPNPYNINRTLTICNGIHSRGVMGAVRCLTDAAVREANEAYLAERFSGRDAFALLLRVPVVAGLALSPDLQNPGNRLYEWPGETDVTGGPS